MVTSIIFLLCSCSLIFSTFAQVPSYLPVCGRRNPKLDECILNSIEVAKPKLIEGIPELDVPPFEPLYLPEGLPLANSPGLKATATNVKLWNVRNWETKYFHADLKNQKFDFKLHFPAVQVEGDYQIDAKILVLINGNGRIKIDTKDVDADVSLHYKLTKTKKGMQHYFTSMTCKLTIGDYVAEYTPTDTASAPLSQAINTVINSNRQEIVDNIVPLLEKAISNKILEISNRIVQYFTYDELFPDRE